PFETLRAHRLARAAGRRPDAKNAPDLPPLRGAARRRRGPLRRVARRSVRHARIHAHRAQRAIALAARLDGPLPRPLPQAGAEARSGEPPRNRHRGRDFLPPEHVLEREPGALPGRVRRRSRLSDIVARIWYT